ncbi:NAD(P)H-dependent glycerol-3-phosphate dehydrogenase [Curvivirga aplysinae]|uniref:NAD(P)H-dependent glycerol-3-phosphate dehydrogenase n=1 Tax=Curvivirga aplysinae TaxID=2529852 RepID=UPI0012BCEC38|nr:NAD(P)H-dependent glycerol-3-phosphate dehydrogenase [Curvivirga aplysinae]MTI11226.1 NAD(P)-dependent glycerol-3-phosphate dehydrogenase [Curvivirga aplysinae]
MTALKTTVIGGGAWGTALACASRRAGSDVILWARNTQVVEDINEGRGNPLYLPETRLDAGICATGDMKEALAAAEVILLVVPSQHMRKVAEEMAPYVAGKAIALCCKGVEQATGALMHEVAQEVMPEAHIAILSGPTFASEVAIGLPTAVTVASRHEASRELIMKAVAAPTFRPYPTDDLVGAEIGGAVKNVLAIACGIVTGRELGENARAALVTRGLAEVMRLGEKLGAKSETLMSLCGLGDLALTCNSPQSRNMSFGIELGKGRSVETILAERRAVTEGVWSATSVTDLARRLDVDMPICEAVNRIVTDGADIGETIRQLLNRPFHGKI